jgi:hypothetical protein
MRHLPRHFISLVVLCCVRLHQLLPFDATGGCSASCTAGDASAVGWICTNTYSYMCLSRHMQLFMCILCTCLSSKIPLTSAARIIITCPSQLPNYLHQSTRIKAACCVQLQAASGTARWWILLLPCAEACAYVTVCCDSFKLPQVELWQPQRRFSWKPTTTKARNAVSIWHLLMATIMHCMRCESGTSSKQDVTVVFSCAELKQELAESLCAVSL